MKKFLAFVFLSACSVHAAAIGGLADLTVYDRNEGRALPVYWHEGRAWVVGKPGNEYQLNVRIRRGEEVLAVLSVDGVNVISGETATVQQSGYVLQPGRALEVKGWRKDLSRTAAFYFTTLADSYATRTGRPDNVGAIGVALFRKKAPEPVPFSQMAPAAPLAKSAREESRGRSDSANSAASGAVGQPRPAQAQIGTGYGRSETSPVRFVGFERATSEPAETVVIYYDSYQKLVARGIVPRVAPAQQVPNPFPGFAAEPPA